MGKVASIPDTVRNVAQELDQMIEVAVSSGAKQPAVLTTGLTPISAYLRMLATKLEDDHG